MIFMRKCLVFVNIALYSFLLFFILFVLGLSKVDAETGTFTNKPPSAVQINKFTAGWQNYTTYATSAWGFSGYSLGDVYAGIDDLRTENTKFYYNNQNWFKNNNWSVTFQIMTMSEDAKSFFTYDRVKVFALTDYGNFECSITPFGVNGGSGNILGVTCSGQRTNTLGFQLNWSNLVNVPLRTYISIRSDYSSYQTNVDTSNTINSIDNASNNIINNNIQNKQEIINNNTQNKQDIINNANKNHEETKKQLEESNDTSKSILQNIIALPKTIINLLTDTLKSLFIPSDDFWQNNFNDVEDLIEKKLGVLGYPFILVNNTLNFFLTLDDSNDYVITWNDVKVPNFNHVIISAGSYDLGSVLEDSNIKYAHDLYMLCLNALILLSFIKLCYNKSVDIFGGQYDDTEYIVVEDSVTDVVDTDRGKRYFTRKEKRRVKAGDEE